MQTGNQKKRKFVYFFYAMSKSHIHVVEKEKKNKERGYTKRNDVQYGTANYIQCELCCCFHFCCCRRHHRCRWCLLLLLYKGINNFDSMVKINVHSIWRLYSPHCVHIFNFIWLFSVAVDREEWNKRTTIMYACMQAIVYAHTQNFVWHNTILRTRWLFAMHSCCYYSSKWPVIVLNSGTNSYE